MKYEIAPKSTETRLNCEDAFAYCDSLIIDGKTGWRLPTKEEYNAICKSKNDFVAEWYWTSDSKFNNWLQHVANDYLDGMVDNVHYYVRAVRDI